MEDIALNIEDQQAHVTASAIIRISRGNVALCLFSPDGGECEVFLSTADALSVKTMAFRYHLGHKVVSQRRVRESVTKEFQI